MFNTARYTCLAGENSTFIIPDLQGFEDEKEQQNTTGSTGDSESEGAPSYPQPDIRSLKTTLEALINFNMCR